MIKDGYHFKLLLKKGYLDMVKYISQDLEDKNPADNKGDTPLDIVAQKGNLEIVNYIPE